MAQVKVFNLIDDVDGSVLDKNTAVQLKVVVNKDAYVLDLSEANAEKFAEAVAPFLNDNTRAGHVKVRDLAALFDEKAPSATGSRDPKKNALVRAWALEQGLEVSRRGRISQEIIDAYEAAVVSEPSDLPEDVVPSDEDFKKVYGKNASEYVVPSEADDEK